MPHHSIALPLARFQSKPRWIPSPETPTPTAPPRNQENLRSRCRNGRVGAPRLLFPPWLRKLSRNWRFWRKILMPKWVLVVLGASFRCATNQFNVFFASSFTSFRFGFYCNSFCRSVKSYTQFLFLSLSQSTHLDIVNGVNDSLETLDWFMSSLSKWLWKFFNELNVIWGDLLLEVRFR